MAHQNSLDNSPLEQHHVGNHTSLDLNLSQKNSAHIAPKDPDQVEEVGHMNAAESGLNPLQDNIQVQSGVIATTGNADYGLKNPLELANQSNPITPQITNGDPGEITTNAQSEHRTPKRGAASSGRKRKSSRVSKQSPSPCPSETNKKVLLALGVNDDEVITRSPKHQQLLHKPNHQSTPSLKSKQKSNNAPDIAERKVLLDERKIRLAEQRFALEEKKLDATIEIGKGLIISMERMTDTISALGSLGSSRR